MIMLTITVVIMAAITMMMNAVMVFLRKDAMMTGFIIMAVTVCDPGEIITGIYEFCHINLMPGA